MSGPVFVTGGSGFVGSHLIEGLRERGYTEIRALVRRNQGWLSETRHDPVAGDLDDLDVLSRAIEGCETVFHVAGRTRARRWEDFEAANVTGTVNLLRAAARLPKPPRVLIVSSLAAVGRSEHSVADEQTPLRPVSMYGRSKASMEEAVSKLADAPPWTIVRPPAVYGPRDSDIFTVFQGAARGVFAIASGPSDGPALTLVHVRDLVGGIIDAALSPDTVGKTYFLGSDPSHSWTTIRDRMREALGRRSLTLRVPRGLIVPAGTVVERVAGLFGVYPPFNREKALEIRDACIMCSSEAARDDFGYVAGTPLSEGFAETVSWYRSRGWL